MTKASRRHSSKTASEDESNCVMELASAMTGSLSAAAFRMANFKLRDQSLAWACVSTLGSFSNTADPVLKSTEDEHSAGSALFLARTAFVPLH
jgi:hypothetical protein